MEASELRIGNWFLDYEAEPEKTTYWEVEEICKYSDCTQIGVKYRKSSSWTSDPKPISLTEEWLTNLGFRKDEANHIYLFPETDSYRLWGFRWNLEHFSLNAVENWDEVNTPAIKYVHQLQNLYYALTGKELEHQKKG